MTNYPVLKPSGIVWLGDIPKHWKVEKLKYISKLINDGTHFTPQYLDDTEGGIVFLRVTDIHDRFIDLQTVKRISLEEHEEINRRCNPERGDLLLSKNGTIGLTKVIDWDFPCSLFVSLCLIKPLNKLNSYFLDYVFKSGLIDVQLDAGSKATTVTNLHLEKIREFQIVLPLIQEQNAITHYLDQVTQQIDEALRLKKEQLEQLDTYRKTLIQETVTKGLDKNVPLSKSGVDWIGDVPKHWKIERLKDICDDILSGGTPKSNVIEYWEGGHIVWLSPTDFQDYDDSDYVGNSRVKITNIGYADCSAKLLPVGTVIMTSRASIGLAKISSEILCTNQGFMNFICRAKLNNKFLLYLINSFLGFKFQNIATGTTFLEISRRTVKQEKIPLPTFDEQTAIVNFLDKKMEQIARLKANIKEQITELEAYRKSLIYECVTGKRQVIL